LGRRPQDHAAGAADHAFFCFSDYADRKAYADIEPFFAILLRCIEKRSRILPGRVAGTFRSM
jgi:hypothetical protein